jgi:hypothetical protein
MAQVIFHWGFNDPEFIPGLIDSARESILWVSASVVVALAALTLARHAGLHSDVLETCLMWLLGPVLLCCWRWWVGGGALLDLSSELEQLFAPGFLVIAWIYWPVIVAGPVFLALVVKRDEGGSRRTMRAVVASVSLGLFMFLVLPSLFR